MPDFEMEPPNVGCYFTIALARGDVKASNASGAAEMSVGEDGGWRRDDGVS
jgi:hypothetical protein